MAFLRLGARLAPLERALQAFLQGAQESRAAQRTAGALVAAQAFPVRLREPGGEKARPIGGQREKRSGLDQLIVTARARSRSCWEGR